MKRKIIRRKSVDIPDEVRLPMGNTKKDNMIPMLNYDVLYKGDFVGVIRAKSEEEALDELDVVEAGDDDA